VLLRWDFFLRRREASRATVISPDLGSVWPITRGKLVTVCLNRTRANDLSNVDVEEMPSPAFVVAFHRSPSENPARCAGNGTAALGIRWFRFPVERPFNHPLFPRGRGNDE